jgi:imidazolonepropionase-like amidohydrolase
MRNKPDLFCLAVLAAVPLHAEVKVLKNFTLIDGTGAAPAAGTAMIVDNGRISWVGPVAKLKAPAQAAVIDLSGKYVMPGIINLHGHLGATVDLNQSEENLTEENTEKNLKTYASYGVTTVLRMGTDKDLVIAMRDKQRATGRPGETRIFSAAQGFVFKGGYGGLAGVNGRVASSSEVPGLVAAQAAKKVDIIKLWVDDELGAMPKMPYDIAKAIVDNAHKNKLPATAHIFYLADAKMLTSYGVNGLAHSVRDQLLDQELIDSMKKHGTWQQAATLSREATMFAYAKPPSFINDPFFTRGVSQNVVAILTNPGSDFVKSKAADKALSRYPEFLENAQKNFKKLVDGGVKYGFGTDSGPTGRFPGYLEHWEMELMVQAGLTPSQVIQAASKNAAEFLKKKDLGTLEKAKWADLIVLDKNPLDDIRNSRSIDSVYIAGNRVK